MSAQHSYQSVMNRMENVSYLVLPTCTSSDRSATALKSIQDCTFPLYWIPTHVLFWQGRHSTIPHHRCLVIFKSVRTYMFWNWFRGYAVFLSCYVSMWKLTVCDFFYLFIFFSSMCLSVCVSDFRYSDSRCDIQAGKGRSTTLPYWWAISPAEV